MNRKPSAGPSATGPGSAPETVVVPRTRDLGDGFEVRRALPWPSAMAPSPERIEAMTITLDHTIVPAHDRDASARFFAGIFGLAYDGPAGHFAPVRVNATLTLDFAEADAFESHHYAFHVDDAEFDAILQRVQAAGIPYGSDPWHLEDRRLNSWNGGRGFYFRDPSRHVLEVMTRV